MVNVVRVSGIFVVVVIIEQLQINDDDDDELTAITGINIPRLPALELAFCVPDVLS